MRRNRAFTLLEVLVAMSVFLLLAGGIFTTVIVSTRAVAEMAALRMESERLDGFERLLRAAFANLPADASLSLAIENGRSGDEIQLSMSPAPAALDMGLGTGDEFRIRVAPGAGGTSEIFMETVASTAAGPAVSLLPGVQWLRWEFTDAEGRKQETWSRDSGRPVIVGLGLKLSSGTERRLEFRVPKTQMPPALATAR